MDTLYTNEEWQDIFILGIANSKYQISNRGRVFDTQRQVYLQVMHTYTDGFMRVKLRTLGGSYKTFVIHRLMLEMFRPSEFKEAEINKLFVIFKDGNVRNIDLENLRFGSKEEANNQRTAKISAKKEAGTTRIDRTNK